MRTYTRTPSQAGRDHVSFVYMPAELETYFNHIRTSIPRGPRF